MVAKRASQERLLNRLCLVFRLILDIDSVYFELVVKVLPIWAVIIWVSFRLQGCVLQEERLVQLCTFIHARAIYLVHFTLLGIPHAFVL